MHRSCTRVLVGLSLFLAAIPCAEAQAIDFRANGIRMTTRVRSLQEIRQENVIHQKWDLSCGSAALSTLLTYDLRTPTPETEVIVWILHRTNPVKIQSRGGFSLLDLKRYAVAHGFTAEGYADLTLDDLVGMKRAAIVPVRVKGYNHFVVFRGLFQSRVFLADPAFGNLTLPKERFGGIWKNGLAFFIYRSGTEATGASMIFAGDPLIPDGATLYRATVGQAILQPARPLR